MNSCNNCHVIDQPGVGSGAGPNLFHEGTKQPDIDWQIAHLKNPAKMKPGSFMPAYGKLSNADLKALAEYLVSHK
jgi:mono/diheme cytochrome c family protein